MEDKKINPNIRASESFFLGALLAIVGGYLDAYTYLLRGGVFANAQTGNIVLLGIDLARLDLWQALGHFIPITAFAAGVMVTEVIRRRFCCVTKLHWRQSILLIEVCVLILVGFVPAGKWDWIINVSISFICSLQVCSFRSMAGTAYATTMCTGNLRSATQLFFERIAGNREAGRVSVRIYGIIGFFVAGAITAAVLVRIWGEKSIWVCCILLLAAFCLMFEWER